MGALNNFFAIVGGLFKIAGSLAMFLYGMKVMSDGIQKTAGDRLQQIMNFMTNNRVTAVFTGFLITALIQSSSATTVMVVSFVNAGLLNLAQSIGVIMGANIGTTVTGWIVAIFGFKFKIALLALPCIGIGFPFFFAKSFKKRYVGEILVGFGLLFLGLTFLKDSVPNLKDSVKGSIGKSSIAIELKSNELLGPISEIEDSVINIENTVSPGDEVAFDFSGDVPKIKKSVTIIKGSATKIKTLVEDSLPDSNEYLPLLDLIKKFRGNDEHLSFWGFLFFVLVGSVLTVIVQSSSAAMAITLTLLSTGWIDFETAAAIVLGENIGTTITAYLASLGANVNARRASRAHTLFNLFGVLWMAAAFRLFIILLDWLIPDSVETRLAMFHTIFNITNTFIFIWFVPLLARIVVFLVKPGRSDKKVGYQLEYLSSGIQDTPEINIIKAKAELSKMSEITGKMFSEFMEIFPKAGKKIEKYVEDAGEQEEYTDTMQVAISKYLVECAKENLNEISANNVNAMIRIVHELESIGDSCYNLAILAQRKVNKKVDLSKSAIAEILDFASLVKEFLEFNGNHLNEHLQRTELELAIDLEKRVDDMRNHLTKAARKRLQKGSDVQAELMFIDVVKHLEHIGDYSLNISQALRAIK